MDLVKNSEQLKQMINIVNKERSSEVSAADWKAETVRIKRFGIRYWSDDS